MFDGWTLFDYVLLAWLVIGFNIFAFAGLLQMPENEKRAAEEAKQTGTSKLLMMPGRLYITPTKFGILGGFGFVMVTSGFATIFWRMNLDEGDAFFVAVVLSLFTAWGLFRLGWAIRARMNGKTE